VDNERKPDDVEHHLHRYSLHMPEWLGRLLRWIVKGTRWVRIPIALVFIVGGLFGFLPVLGFWMVPIGLLLLAVDVPFLRRPMIAFVLWLEDKWARWRGKPVPAKQLPLRREGEPR
jgi:hypothetical protein